MATEKSVMAVIRASRPSFRNDHDKVAFAVHASFLSAGLVLTATGEPAFTQDPFSSSSTDEVGIEGWNRFDEEYAFVYVNTDKGNNKVLVKCLAMDDKLMVDALSDGAPEPVHTEIKVNEYVGEGGGSDYSAKYKNLGRLVGHLDSEILRKLDGSTPTPRSHPAEGTSCNTDGSSFTVTEPQQSRDHLMGVVVPPVNPIPGSDLFPGSGAGVYPARADFGGSGSMLLGPDDPRWRGIAGEPDFPAGLGVPPGARFDPYGPPGVPGFEPGRFSRGPRRPPGTTHPDLEQPGGGGGFDFPGGDHSRFFPGSGSPDFI